MQVAQYDGALLEGLNSRHRGHPSNYADIGCPVCLACCAYHIQQEDKHAIRSREIIHDVPLSTINDAIREVSTALGDDTLVRPISAGGLRA